MARPKTPDGKRVTLATKLSEPTAAAIDAQRGPVTRSEWLANAATDALDHYRHERTDRCHHRAEHLLTCDEYDALRIRARGRCEICRTPEPETPRGLLTIDHYEDQHTWYVRGLLCDQCNNIMSCQDGRKPWGGNRFWQTRAAEYASRAFQVPSETPRGRKVVRAYRVAEDLYAATADKAASRGETVTDVLIRGLRAYVRGESVEGAVVRQLDAPMPPERPSALSEPVWEPASDEELPAEPAAVACRHPAEAVDAGECRLCGADVW